MSMMSALLAACGAPAAPAVGCPVWSSSLAVQTAESLVGLCRKGSFSTCSPDTAEDAIKMMNFSFVLHLSFQKIGHNLLRFARDWLLFLDRLLSYYFGPTC